MEPNKIRLSVVSNLIGFAVVSVMIIPFCENPSIGLVRKAGSKRSFWKDRVELTLVLSGDGFVEFHLVYVCLKEL